MSTAVRATPRRPVDVADFLDLTPAAVTRIQWVGEDGELEVEFAADLPSLTVALVKRRMESRNSNEETLRTQAEQALQDNRDWLALANPNQAQTLAQLRALTRQNNAMIRLLLGQLDGTN